MKRVQQEKLLMVKLEVINTPIKRLEQEKLLMVKLVVISISIKRRTGETTDGHSGGDITSNLTICSFCCSSLCIDRLITSSLTICSFCCSNLFIEGLITSNY
jgi:hypothetical protein